jgi:hypothetical protein
MTKGFEVIQVIGTFMILIVTAIITWNFISGGYETTASAKEYENDEIVSMTCSTDKDCESSPYGVKCYNIYSTDHPEDFASFCGCIVNEDCLYSGTCGQNNRCS